MYGRIPTAEQRPFDDSPEDVEAFREYMHTIPCPRCGGEMRITLPQ
jgi:hypothetical protein